MSNLDSQIDYDEPCDTNTCSAIELIIQPRQRDLGGFSVRRVLPIAQRRMVGPWIFFDHMGPTFFPAGEGIDIRPHPHINLATVTYLFEGEILHRDSLANLQAIRPGDINLMVAGKGIVHSERETPEMRNRDHTQHGLQLWLALPEADEEIEPAFYHYPSTNIPKTTIEGVTIRVMMGSAYGITSPVKTFAQTLYAEAYMQVGQCITLPQFEERAVYVAQGQLSARDSVISQYEMGVFSAQPGIVLKANEETRIAIIGGERMSQRHLFWNFASSRKERIDQAKSDWENGNFPLVPGDEIEFIPLP